jgi:hydroxymethylbilane synthase
MIRHLASRGSALALWQARHVQARLAEVHPDVETAIDVVTTTGDRITDVPLAQIGDTGLFTREVDRAVLDGRADFAVHSLKDVPTRPPDGLVLVAVPERADPRDALLVAPGQPHTLAELPEGARIGTSSLRRRALLYERRPDLDVADLRGNLDRRLTRLRDAHYDAVLLAVAGLQRMGWDDDIAEILDPSEWLPAPGQGALGIVCRADDAHTRDLLESLDDPHSRAATTAERTLLRTLEGGCQIPIGALAIVDGTRMRLRAFVSAIDGRDVVRGELEGAIDDPAALGNALAQDMIARGAARILDAVRAQGEDGVPRPVAP